MLPQPRFVFENELLPALGLGECEAIFGVIVDQGYSATTYIWFNVSALNGNDKIIITRRYLFYRCHQLINLMEVREVDLMSV